MVTPTQKIAAGIDALEAAKKDNTLTTTRLAKYVNGPKDLSAVITLARSISEKADTFDKRMTMLRADAKAQREMVTAEVNGYEGVDATTKRGIIEKKVATLRKELRDRTSKERYNTLSDIDAAAKQVSAVKDLYRSPATMLMREGLGSEKRSRYLHQLANSGPTELEAMAALAANTGNVVLGAAVLSTLDGIKNKKDRELVNVSRDELSSLMVGDQFAKAQEALLIVANRTQASFNSNHAFELGKDNPTARIGMALRKQNETGILDDHGEGE